MSEKTAQRGRGVTRTVLEGVPVLMRILVGFMLLMGGRLWLSREDPGAYLTDALQLAFDRGSPFGFYAPFLRGVVIPNVDTFALLVGWGELLSGASLLLGLGTRIGGAVAIFQFLNYGLHAGVSGMIAHGVLIAMIGVALTFNAGRRLGIDGLLHWRWPAVRIW